MQNNKKVVVIGAGFGGLGSAIILAKQGYDVTVVEKNDKAGGRANLLEANGFKRDMGPSRYLMPEAFDKFFDSIGEKVSDHFELEKLSPSYRVYFKDEKGKDDNTYLDIYSDIDKAAETFESIEVGAGEQLRKYLKSSEYQYDIAMNKFVYKNFDSIWDFMTPQLAMEGLQLNIFTTLYNYVSRFIKDERLKKILMYPSVFLGTSPYETPALFNIMSHVDFNQGVFYPKGGIYEIIKTLQKIATANGVKFLYNSEVSKIDVENRQAKGIYIENKNSLTLPEGYDILLDDGKDLDQKIQLYIYLCEGDDTDRKIDKGFTDAWNRHIGDGMFSSLLKYKNKYCGFAIGGTIDETQEYVDRNIGNDYLNSELYKFDKDIQRSKIHYIQGVFVLKNHRGLNLGKLLLDYHESQLLKAGYKYIILDVDAKDTKLVNWYISLGYTILFDYEWVHKLKPEVRNNNVFMIKKIKQNTVKSEDASDIYLPADIIVSNADMHHTETKLLETQNQSYPESYRAKKVISPSGFILYLGVDGELPQLQHHTLIFNHDRKEGFAEVFSDPKWPSDPSYYICNPSKTDPSTAPAGKENLFVLVPIAPGLECSDEILAKYSDLIISDIAKNCNIPDLASRIEFSQIFSIPQFEQYYNAYKGTALGLAHTFFQSAVRRSNNYSKKVKGLYYAGGYTTPGIGMPMCLISAMMVAERINQKSK